MRRGAGVMSDSDSDGKSTRKAAPKAESGPPPDKAAVQASIEKR